MLALLSLVGGGAVFFAAFPAPTEQAAAGVRGGAATHALASTRLGVGPPRDGLTFVPTAMDDNTRWLERNEHRIKIRGFDMPNLLNNAFSWPSGQVDWQTPMPEGRFDVDLYDASWRDVMKSELGHEFGLVFESVEREVRVWVVKADWWPGHRLAPTAVPESAGSHETGGPGRHVFQKCSVAALAMRMQFEMSALVFDETGDEGWYDFSIPARGTEALAAYAARIAGITGLRIESELRTLPFLVITRSGPSPPAAVAPVAP